MLSNGLWPRPSDRGASGADGPFFMRPDTAPDDSNLIAHFEGLVRKTAALTVEHCEEEFDDICQLFRIKAWKALLSFDPSKVRASATLTVEEQRDRYVYACIKNQAKDLVKRVRRHTTYIADQMEQDTRFEMGFLGVAEEQVFNLIEESTPLIPSTLDSRERRIVTLLYLDFDNGEIGAQLGIQRKQVATLVRGIREKMADWAPPGWEPSGAKDMAKAKPSTASPKRVPLAQQLPVAA